MNEQSFEYRTGQTRPGKSSRGLIAFLLICVIFLSGVVSILSVANIQLLRLLQQQDAETPLSFQEGDAVPTTQQEATLTVGGITLQELPELYGELYNLPDGLYVTSVSPEGTVVPGDVLVSFDGNPVTTLEQVNTLYTQKKAGDHLRFTFHRQGETFSYTIILGN